MTLPSRSSLLLALVATGFVGWTWVGSTTPTLEANVLSGFEDSDGDMLPDTLEWVLMTDPNSADSDNDGRDDFLEAVQFEVNNGLATPPALDHEMRTIVSGVGGHVFVNTLLRIVPGEHVTQLDSFLEFADGTRIPLSPLLWNTVVHADVRLDPNEGIYVLVTSWVATEPQFKTLLPCAVGTDGTIGSRTFTNGSSMVETNNSISQLVSMPQGTGPAYSRYTVQPIDQDPVHGAPGGGGGGSTFWQRSKACVMELSGSGGTSTAVDAHCSGAPTLVCASNCTGQSGQVFVTPNGLPFITGK